MFLRLSGRYSTHINLIIFYPPRHLDFLYRIYIYIYILKNSSSCLGVSIFVVVAFLLFFTASKQKLCKMPVSSFSSFFLSLSLSLYIYISQRWVLRIKVPNKFPSDLDSLGSRQYHLPTFRPQHYYSRLFAITLGILHY